VCGIFTPWRQLIRDARQTYVQHQQLIAQPYLPVAEHVAWQQQLQQQYAAVVQQQQV
jgi:hypothetical protein